MTQRPYIIRASLFQVENFSCWPTNCLCVVSGWWGKYETWEPSSAAICNFWHPGTLTLSHECQSARMSKITKDGFTRSGTGCFTAVLIRQQWASRGQSESSEDREGGSRRVWFAAVQKGRWEDGGDAEAEHVVHWSPVSTQGCRRFVPLSSDSYVHLRVRVLPAQEQPVHHLWGSRLSTSSPACCVLWSCYHWLVKSWLKYWGRAKLTHCVAVCASQKMSSDC